MPSSQTVLLIDASRTIRTTSNMFLGPTYNVLLAENLTKAEEHLKENVPGIVVVATNGPADGHTLVEKIRHDLPDAAIGILYPDSTIDQSEHAHPDVHMVLQKPFTKDELVGMVDQLQKQHRIRRVASERKILNETVTHASSDRAPSRNRL